MSNEAEENVDVVNMVQVLEDEELLQQDANAVLGASDAVECTYSKGYVLRQALYACCTCCLLDNEFAGVCLACALECHEGHDLVELYTKRHFRCDCGNSKFVEGVKVCKLCPEKAPTNSDNRYNQNFKGLYCRCARPYPDPDDSIDDQMLQCNICEDWFHSRHLGRDDDLAVDQEGFDELTCEICTDRCSFLRTYARSYSVGGVNDNDKVVDVEGEGGVSSTGNSCFDQPSSSSALTELTNDAETPTCKLKELAQRSTDLSSANSGAVYWCSNWRQKLCKCKDCLALYESLDVSFLTDESDTIAAYEERGKQMSSKSSYDKGLEALQSINRVQQVELVNGFDELKTELKDYLKKFADNGKVVRQEDIAEFFTQLEARKRTRVNAPMQYYCK